MAEGPAKEPKKKKNQKKKKNILLAGDLGQRESALGKGRSDKLFSKVKRGKTLGFGGAGVGGDLFNKTSRPKRDRGKAWSTSLGDQNKTVWKRKDREGRRRGKERGTTNLNGEDNGAINKSWGVKVARGSNKRAVGGGGSRPFKIRMESE